MKSNFRRINKVKNKSSTILTLLIETLEKLKLSNLELWELQLSLDEDITMIMAEQESIDNLIYSNNKLIDNIEKILD